MLVNKKEDLAPIPGLPIRRLLSGGVCVGLFALLTRVVVTTPWAKGPSADWGGCNRTYW
jgi:NAD(P)H-quinone oxidoreductase subunit 6